MCVYMYIYNNFVLLTEYILYIEYVPSESEGTLNAIVIRSFEIKKANCE
jgi:hypothetical protein